MLEAAGRKALKSLMPFRIWLKGARFGALFHATAPPSIKPHASLDESYSRLEACCEHLFDAYTIDDAVYWHCEIINELAIVINGLRQIQTTGGSSGSIKLLEKRQEFHTEAVSR